MAIFEELDVVESIGSPETSTGFSYIPTSLVSDCGRVASSGQWTVRSGHIRSECGQ